MKSSAYFISKVPTTAKGITKCPIFIETRADKILQILEPEKDPLKPTVDVVIAGHILGVPAGSLGFFLEKRLNFIARKHLMPFEQVVKFYSVDSDPYKAGLRKIACASIFNAWWEYRLDESATPELMEELSDLREDFPELDQDLHDAVEEKDAAMEKSRLERKAKREAEQSGADGGFGNSFDQNNNDTGFGGDWDKSATAAPATSEWIDQENVADNNFSDWDKPTAHFEKHNGDDNPGETSGDWADEVNEQFQPAPFVTAPTSGW